MKVVNIKLSLLENAKRFADIASRYPFDVDLRVGRYVVDILMATLPGFFVINFFSIFFMLRVEQDVPIDNNDTINKTEFTILMNCFI